MIGDILQPTHLLFILVIALIVLGPKRLPEVGRSLGRGLRDFRTALSGADPREDLAELGQIGHPAPDATTAPESNAEAAEIQAEPTPEPTPVPAAPPSDESAEHSED